MEKLIQGKYTGERALYNIHDKELIDCTFEDGESPLKECSSLKVNGCIFKWKYPFWYCKDIEVTNSTLLDTARSCVWYDDNISFTNCSIECPKIFRRCSNVRISDCYLPNAQETLWTCNDVSIKNVTAKGDYFGMNCQNVEVDHLLLDGNYCFDGGKNIVVRNSKLLSKDSFWNSENVTIYDSLIIGEYLGWNAKKMKLINCTIDSNQGMCYIDNLQLENCKLLNTDLAFERCKDIKATITSKIDSVKNPYNGYIEASGIDNIIMDKDIVDPNKTTIKINK